MSSSRSLFRRLEPATFVLLATALLACTPTATVQPAAPVPPVSAAPVAQVLPSGAEALARSGVVLPDGKAIPNLATIKLQIQSYEKDGVWATQIQEQSRLAIAKLDQLLPGTTKPAIVFDIDDTALSTYPIQEETNFGFVKTIWDDWVDTKPAKANQGMLDLYRHAIENHVAVFFITGRRTPLRAGTERQLRTAGYTEWTQLHLRPTDDHQESVVPYKSSKRREIESQGYTILVNVGDQWSDLDGGVARSTFKIPNPIYFLP